jgi:predicted permease
MFGRRRKSRDFRREIDAHLALETERLRSEGLGEEEARTAARRAFGNVALAEEHFYESGRWLWWDHLQADVRYGLRMLARSPGFTVIAVLTLALGIGANTAIFTVIEAALLRALPVSQPGQLVLLTDPNAHGHSFGDGGAGPRELLEYSEFEYLRDHNDVFSGIFAADSSLPQVPVRLSSLGGGSSEQNDTARVQLVSGDYFSTLGIHALRGRTFTSSVDRARGASPVAVISYAFWQRRFNLDPAALGQTIDIRQTPFTIIGVMPPGFFGETVGDAPEIWAPLTMQAAVYPGVDMLSPVHALQHAHIWLEAMARLKPGVTIQQAQANVSVVFRRHLEAEAVAGMTAHERADYFGQQISLWPGARGAATVRGAMGDPLKLLMGLVGLVLLIACANVANLLLARGSARQREFAIRAAIGAGRSRLMRQLLVESLLLAFSGAAAGVLVAPWVSGLLVRMMPGISTEPAAVHLDLALNMPVLIFALALTVLTALIFGLIPAWRAARVDINAMLKSATAAPVARPASPRASAGKFLVVGQVAASVILLVAAGLFVHSLARLAEVNLGYKPERLLLVGMNTASAGYQDATVRQFYRRMLDRLAAIPGIHSVSVSTNGLFQGNESGDSVWVEGYTPPQGENPHSRMDHVGPGYFRTLGIPILLGREIEAQDAAPARRVAVINQAFAQAFFPHTDPLGKSIRDVFPGNPGEMVVVGVAANDRSNSLRETFRPRVYIPLFNPLWPHNWVSFEMRTEGDPAAIGTAIREAAAEINPNLLPLEIEALPRLVDRSLGRDRFIARLAAAFALLAALLAGIGLYGVMACTVARRTRDIGIRMALGAAPSEILQSVLRETLLLVGIGVVVGIPAAIAGTRLIKSLLFGLGFIDPAALTFAVGLLAAVAVFAGFVPARRAARVDPMAAIRFV